MAGISMAVKTNNIENKYKFNKGSQLQNKEFSDGSGLEMYDAVNRMYDPQLGRFWQLDEFGEIKLSWSAYSFADDNPISYSDPLGLTPEDENKKLGRKKHGFTPDDPNVLTEVTVRANHSTKNLESTYWYYRMFGGGLDKAPKDIQDWLYRKDRIQRWNERVSAEGREFDRNVAEFALWFIPIPGLGELKLAGKLGQTALKLFRFRRAAGVTEKIIANGAKDYAHYGLEFIDEGVRTVEQPFAKAAESGSLALENSVSAVMGDTYSAVGEVTVQIKNTELLEALNATSKGTWVKVYEAGLLNGEKVETHYFRNELTKEVFDVKIKTNKWAQKAFKNF
jgi:RHS repeat-associated protein